MVEMAVNIIANTEAKPNQHQELAYYFYQLGAICRVCLDKSPPNKRMVNIFDIKESQIPTMMMACAAIQISDGDGLPNTICSKCLAKLNVAWQFKNLTENTDAKLRDYYYSKQFHHISVDFEDDLDSIAKHEGMILPTENLKRIVTELVDEDHGHNEEDADIDLNSDIRDNKTKKKLKKQKSKKIHRKVHQCDTCGRTFTRREYLTQHIRIHTGEKPYHCHTCEKRFLNSGHLTTHMRTHTGEKPHNCTMCDKSFSTRQGLQKHTMVHKGERPFVCKTCDRSFGSSSNLYTHSKHHTGEKNFTCEHCGKTFYTKQELIQHIVVHTGEKSYLCEYCHRRFSQMAHLTRHYKLHKC